MTSRRRTGTGGVEPLSHKRKWQTITVATLVIVPAYWSMLAGLIAIAGDEIEAGPNPAAALALGLALIPFAFVILAFMSLHPRAPGAVIKAMVWSIAVGVPVSAVAADAVTGIVAGVGAGGAVALRADLAHSMRTRALAVVVASLYTFVLVRTVAELALLPAPIFPFTALGLADHLSEWRHERGGARS